MIEKECLDAETTASTSREEAEEPSVKKKDEKETAMTFLLGTTANSTQCTDEDRSGKGEFEWFKRERQLHHDECALSWWKSNQEWFLITKVACKLLCITASERIFSTAGLTVSNLRSSLKPENIDMLIF